MGTSNCNLIGNNPCHDWIGIVCSNASAGVQSVVTSIQLRNSSLIGTVPKSLRNCSSLTRVWLERNQLSGNMSEVQMRSGRVPVWHKSKIHFYVMAPQLYEELNEGGEVDVETIPVHEVEVRQKDLLPVIDSYRAVHPDWTDGQ